MKAVATVLLLAAATVASASLGGGFKRSATRGPELIKTPRPHEYMTVEDIPDALDWRNVSGKNYVSRAHNQHIPNYCGSCWAFSTAATLSDRLAIQRADEWPQINIGVQSLLECSMANDGCHGGDYFSAMEFFHANNATDETCNSYVAKGHDVGLMCTDRSFCGTCSPDAGCSAIAPESYWSVGVSEYGNLKGDVQIKSEIAARGPVSCGIAVTAAFEAYTGGVFHDTTGAKTAADIDHAINIVGWGTDDTTGEDFWVMKNSWGTPWGEHGYARVTTNRTENMCLDCDCVFGVPTAPKAPTAAVPTKADGDAIKYHAKTKGIYHRVPENTWAQGMRITEPLPADTVPTASLPANWDWREQNKVLLASADKNQHIPVYCGSCWSQGTTSALSDRLAIATDGQWPAVNLAPQVVINYGGCGDCQGGDPSCVYGFVHSHGVPDQTCQQYMADNGQYDAMGICETCHPTQAHFWPGQCEAVKNYTSWYVGDYGAVTGALAMQKEIYARGPISCGVDVTPEFETFTGDGIFNQPLSNPQIDHEISIAGWGTDAATGVQYWLLRNSWGSSWGYRGWAKVAFGSIGVETDCSWGVPQTTAPSGTGSGSGDDYYTT